MSFSDCFYSHALQIDYRCPKPKDGPKPREAVLKGAVAPLL